MQELVFSSAGGTDPGGIRGLILPQMENVLMLYGRSHTAFPPLPFPV